MVKGDLSMSGFTCCWSGSQRYIEDDVFRGSFYVSSPLPEMLINATPCTFSALISFCYPVYPPRASSFIPCVAELYRLPLFKYPIDLNLH